MALYLLKERDVPRFRALPTSGGPCLALHHNMMISKRDSKSASVDVLELLASQHAEVDVLFAKLESGEGDRGALFSELANKLAAHATVEEKLFYPAVMAKQTHELLHEAVEEHLEIKRVLADLLIMKVDEDTFAAKLSVLKEDVAHHAHEEEEEQLFPILRELMTSDELGALGNETLAMFETVMATNPARTVPSQTKSAAHLPGVA